MPPVIGALPPALIESVSSPRDSYAALDKADVCKRDIFWRDGHGRDNQGRLRDA
jgi:hypothetical protein